MGMNRENFCFLAAGLIFVSSISVLNAGDAIRITDYESSLKNIHQGATKVEEIKIDPTQSGGSTLMGLVGRSMGTSPSSEFEGMGINRYIYAASKGKELVGVSHGSTIEVSGKPLHVIVHYDSSANLKAIDVKEAPAGVMVALKSGNYLDQLKGYSTEDFATKYERKRRRTITHRGRALKELKYPSGGEVREYFEKIVRSLKYNVAFVDIAYFISKLPMMDLQSRRISSIARSAGSPEAIVESTTLTSPTGDRSKTFMIDSSQ